MEDIEKKDRQLENLENLVENYTRTERHLEQYSHIGNQENKEHARKIQEDRKEQIEELENNIKGIDENDDPEEQLENLKERYNNTQNYIQNNRETIDEQTMRNLQEKQQHREEQIIFLEDEK